MKEDGKEFPMLNGPSIPWWLAEEIYKAYSAIYGTSQSLEVMASRGGFGWDEIPFIAKEYQRRFRKLPEGWRL